MELSLTKLPWYAQLGAFVVLAGVGVGMFFYQYELPARAEMADRQAQLASLKDDIMKGLETAKQLPAFQSQVADLEERLESLRAVLPEEKDAAELLRRLQTMAVQSNLTIRAFRPEETVTQQLHAEWPIALELDGTYHNLAMFFDRVAKHERIVNITGLQVRAKPQPEPDSSITAQCVATTFVLLDTPASPAAGAAGSSS